MAKIYYVGDWAVMLGPCFAETPFNKNMLPGILLMASVALLPAAELHVATTGDDRNPGTREAPLLSIQRAADLAQAGDTVTVHQGLYRERVDPPRGGESAAKRITYQAAPGEMIGTHWSKGWIIEGCTISHSRCTGITLGLRDMGPKPPATAPGYVHLHGARPSAQESGPLVLADHDPALRLDCTDTGTYLRFTPGDRPPQAAVPVVTSERLGRARVSGQPFVNPDGAPIKIDTDFSGKPRDPHKPAAGPFEDPGEGKVRLAAADGRLL